MADVMKSGDIMATFLFPTDKVQSIEGGEGQGAEYGGVERYKVQSMEGGEGTRCRALLWMRF